MKLCNEIYKNNSDAPFELGDIMFATFVNYMQKEWIE
jgi:hypothetical protein